MFEDVIMRLNEMIEGEAIKIVEYSDKEKSIVYKILYNNLKFKCELTGSTIDEMVAAFFASVNRSLDCMIDAMKEGGGGYFDVESIS